jgi:hypothetical protein
MMESESAQALFFQERGVYAASMSFAKKLGKKKARVK